MKKQERKKEKLEILGGKGKQERREKSNIDQEERENLIRELMMNNVRGEEIEGSHRKVGPDFYFQILAAADLNNLFCSFEY